MSWARFRKGAFQHLEERGFVDEISSYLGSAHETEKYSVNGIFPHIPSCRFISVFGPGEIRSAQWLNSEYSCRPAWQRT